MTNMSYCRFENTSHDLTDCLEALQDPDEEMQDMNEYEKRAVTRLIETCMQIAEDFGDYESQLYKYLKPERDED
jgi:hypothetical protein